MTVEAMFRLSQEVEALELILQKVRDMVADPMAYKPHSVIEFADKIEEMICEELGKMHQRKARP